MKSTVTSLSWPQSQWVRTWGPTLVLLPFCLYYTTSRGESGVVEYLNLLIHEAGHLCFYFLGDTMHAAGGSLMQLLLPAAIVAHFWQYHSVLGMQVGLLWLGQNSLAVSVYVGDARVQELALLSNREHDWTYLLTRYDLLPYDQLIAYGFCVGALICFMVLLMMPFYVSDEG